jgi:hypothetical protein
MSTSPSCIRLAATNSSSSRDTLTTRQPRRSIGRRRDRQWFPTVAFPVLLHAADERGRARPTVSAAEPLGSQRPVANATYDPTQPANVAHRTRRQNDGFSARSADAERHIVAHATITHQGLCIATTHESQS